MIRSQMRSHSLTIRLPTLRSALGALLALHLGLAPAGVAHTAMMHAPIGAVPPAAQDGAVLVYCHEAAAAANAVTNRPASHPPGKSHSACCEVNQCRCMSVCFVAATAPPLFSIANRHTLAPSFVAPAEPHRLPTRQFRPPIAL